MSGSDAEPGRGDEHEVTPLELFFDLTFVFAMTQVTILLADDPTWAGVFRGMLVLAALWWAWSALRVADERDGCRRGRGPACDARLDGRNVRRGLGGAGRLRR
jgi:Bacterial low temperature requirement A protein (LtrA)